MADKVKEKKPQGGSSGPKKKPSKVAYNNEGRDKINKKIRAKRHANRIVKLKARSAKRIGYVLPSYTNRLKKRADKRKSGKTKEVAAEIVAVES